MPKVPTPKKVDKVVLGPSKQMTSEKGPFGGGNKYSQMSGPSKFGMPVVKGHAQQKPNVQPVIKNK